MEGLYNQLRDWRCVLCVCVCVCVCVRACGKEGGKGVQERERERNGEREREGEIIVSIANYSQSHSSLPNIHPSHLIPRGLSNDSPSSLQASLANISATSVQCQGSKRSE